MLYSWLKFPKDESEQINVTKNLRIYKYILNGIEIYYLPDKNYLFKIKNSLIKEEAIKDKMLNINNNYFMLFKLD